MSETVDAARFPEGFIWGASTASYQIEGAVSEDGRAPSIWDTFSHTPGKVERGETGDIACDHYHRHEEDVGLMKALGLDVYRFSIAWPRIIPEGTGEVNEAGLDFYDRLTDSLLEAGIEPWPCLYHWDLPDALHTGGQGWEERASADAFAEYANTVTAKLGDRAKTWLTFNEPNVFTIFGYLIGYHAPGISDHETFLSAVHNVNRAHGKACQVIRSNVPNVRIGLAPNMQPVRPATDTIADREAARILDSYWNRAFADPMVHGRYNPIMTKRLGDRIKPGDMETIHQPLDWFGVNYYSPLYAKAARNTTGMKMADPPLGADISLMGWHADPPSFTDALLDVSKRYPGLPIYITENGTADALPAGEPDQNRIDYYTGHLNALLDAVDKGADVRGYLIWSLMDNFEWALGYRTRFGVIRCDFDTLERTPKASHDWLQALIAQSREPRVEEPPASEFPASALPDTEPADSEPD